MNKKFFVMSLLVLVLATCIRVFYITQKQGFHIDEMISRANITGSLEESDRFLFQNFVGISGYNLKKLYFSRPYNSITEDIQFLRTKNEDVSHPSLYFSLLRVAVNFADYTPQGFIYAGCGLNLILFIFSFFIMRLILIRLFGDNKLVPIGLAIAFLNTGTISMTLFIRPYELQMFAILLISYVYLVIAEKLKNNENISNVKDFCIITSSLAFTFLAGYFLAVYVFFLGCILLWHAKRNIKNLLCLILSVILSVGIVYLITPCYFGFFEGQRFSEVSDKEHKTFSFIFYYCKNLTDFLFYPIVIFLMTVSLFFMTKKIKINGISIVVCALIWSFLIEYCAPFKILRYIAPSFPIISMLLVIILQNIETKKQNILSVLFLSVYFVSALFPIKQESRDTFIRYAENSLFKYTSKIESLYIAETKIEDNNIPVYVESIKWYKPYYLISRLNNSKIYIMGMEREIKENQFTHRHFYLLTDYNKIQLEKKYKVNNLGNFINYKLYEVYKK